MIYTLQVPDGITSLTVSYQLPLDGTSVPQPSVAAVLAPPVQQPPVDTLAESVPSVPFIADEWVEREGIWLHAEWTETDIRHLIRGSSRTLVQPWTRFLALHPDRVYSTAASTAAVGIRPRSIQGMLSGMTRRAAHLGYEHQFFDFRYNFHGDRTWEWHMPEREAAIVLEALS